MVINTTRWSPDTCQCVFDYDWDSDLPNETRTHIFKQVVRECAFHSHLTGNNKKDMYDSSVEENSRKNISFFELLDKAAADFGEVDPQSGAIILKKGINISWTWSGTAPNRVMTLTVTGITLSQPKKTAAQNFLDNRFGSGKVVFVN